MKTMVAKSLSRILADNVKRLRAERGWSQTELAKRVKRPQPRISEIERATASVGINVVDELADAFGVQQCELTTEYEFIGK